MREPFLAAVDAGMAPSGDSDNGRVWVSSAAVSGTDGKLLMRCSSQVLDPIDGTKGFMTGQGYMIGLSLLVDGEVIMGVMGILAAPCTVQVSGVRLLSTEMRTVAKPTREMLAVRS